MNDYHKENMKKHIAYLRDNAEKIRDSFNMFNLFHTCGTPSCSLGYATCSVGMVLTNGDYKKPCLEYFGVRWFSTEWDYMFGYEWTAVNNTPEAAAARMEAVLYNQMRQYWRFTEEFSHPIVIIPEEFKEEAKKLFVKV